ncbi:MAG: multiple sugar transport system substrate-binding protein [Solirubrobacteraceae bacterium]
MLNKAVSRRWLAVVVVIVCAAVVAACGSSDKSSDTTGKSAPKAAGPVPEPTSPVEVTFSSWVGSQPDMKKLAAKFHTQHPNITIKFQNVPAEQASQKLTTQIAGGEPPDVAYLDSSNVNDFASRQALVNLDDYLSRSKLVSANDYVQAFKTSAVYQNHMFGLPIDGESTGLFYRTDLFKAAGIDKPPTNWQEFQADAQKLTNPAKKQYGYIVFAPESAYYWYPWLWQNGGQLLSKDGKDVLFNSAQAKQAADFYVGLTKYSPKDFLNSNSYDGRVAFASGKVAMYMAGAWFAGTLNGEYPKLKGKWAAAPLPQGTNGCATTIAGDTLVLLDGAKNHDAAWKWIEFLSSPENMSAWTFGSPNGTTLPPRTSLLNSPALTEKKPILKGFADQMKCGVANVIANPKWPKIEESLNDNLGKAMYGDKTPSQALDEAASDAKEILSR